MSALAPQSLPEPFGAIEHPVWIACEGDTLMAILHEGERKARRGVVIVVGGDQYRVGAHRHFVQLARHLAAAGVPVLRFDVRGSGDSEGEKADFEQIAPDIKAAVDALFERLPSIDEVVLWGLCDGATAALLYAGSDARVGGLVLANPWVSTLQGAASARLRHHYAGKLSSARFWRRLLRGQVSVASSLRSLTYTLQAALSGRSTEDQLGLPERAIAALASYSGQVLLLLSGRDLTASEFEATLRESGLESDAARSMVLQVCRYPASDHTFSQQQWKLQVNRRTQVWLQGW